MERRNFFKLMGGVALLTALPPFPQAKQPIPAGVIFLRGRGTVMEWRPEKVNMPELPLKTEVFTSRVNLKYMVMYPNKLGG